MKTGTYFIAVDQGSSGTMSALFDETLTMIDMVDLPVSVFTPNYGWVEHDAWELLETVKRGVQQLIERNPGCLGQLGGIGLANQGESFLLWDTSTGEPVTPVISWQDARSEAYCSKLRQEGYNSWFHKKTGLHLSSEWPALKVRELRKSDPDLDARCKSGQIAFGQLDAWFVYALSHGKLMASDHGTACRTGFYNLEQGGWDGELQKFFHGEDLIFPELIDNVCCLEYMDFGIGKQIPWIAGGLDQSVTLIGQKCTQKYMAKVTYGTCCACWMNLGQDILLDDQLTTSVAWKLKGQSTYALAAEGGASGNIITWLQKNFGADWPMEELSHIAKAFDDQTSLIFVPAFQGLAAPYWKEAKGTLFGVTTGTRREHILRAGLDAVAYTMKDIVDSMPKFRAFVADGGMTANDYLIQRQADVLQSPVIRSKEKEGTLMGIVYLCALSLGILDNLDFLDEPESAETFIPHVSGEDSGYRLWKKSVQTVIEYYK